MMDKNFKELKQKLKNYMQTWGQQVRVAKSHTETVTTVSTVPPSRARPSWGVRCGDNGPCNACLSSRKGLSPWWGGHLGGLPQVSR